MTERIGARPLGGARAALGESPVWDPELELLRWVDATRGELRWLRPADGSEGEVRLGERVGSIAARVGGGVLAAVDRELLLLDAAGAVEDRLQGPWGDDLVNDGACDAEGRFWVGSVRPAPETGALFRVEPGGEARAMLTGIGESNGIDFGPGDTVLYHADSRRGTVDAHAFSAGTGQLGERRRLAELAGGEGLPDGLAVDAEGAAWLAVWGAGEVRRYSPAGELLAVVELPVSHVTSCCFGGPGLDRLWITTARGELDPAGRVREPAAGALFLADPGVAGLPARRFGR